LDNLFVDMAESNIKPLMFLNYWRSAILAGIGRFLSSCQGMLKLYSICLFNSIFGLKLNGAQQLIFWVKNRVAHVFFSVNGVFGFNETTEYSILNIKIWNTHDIYIFAITNCFLNAEAFLIFITEYVLLKEEEWARRTIHNLFYTM